MGGFFVSGILLAFLGAILPAWQYHLKSEYLVVGSYFLSLNAGILVSVGFSFRLLPRRGIRFVLLLGSILAFVAFLFLALIPGVAHPAWRIAGVFCLGEAAGLLNTALFHLISGLYEHEPAATINMAGTSFGLGCLVAAVLVAGTYYVYTVPSILLLLSLIPGFFGGMCARWKLEEPPARLQPSMRQALKGFKSPAAVLLSLVLFLQFANEWSIAGWLPLFLIQRLGISPELSLKMLGLYWLSLLVGRVGMQWVLSRVSHWRLLVGSTLAAIAGCGMLVATNNRFGAGTGLLLAGFGFAAIYPLVVEMIGDRFPYYHPGFFNGIFSFALTGGLLAPWTLGIYAHYLGIGVVMLLPLAGACAVFVLLVSIKLYTKLTGVGEVSAGAR